ncbi:hypothetical protein [Pseudoduganella chitinolytica]|uniref:Uncharacterized protein n=1 Tax=Pseudoduganella chitinolytica TaxID=34070 RepID=A0ABY8BAP1_9BURK|nr:hypothetical protein [Pseudoduganella chitinolytica]WEF32061.1 hypothetical protein PX653_21930 [Pseudoduganella chitinolytica]
MLYVGLAIIVAGIMAALSPLAREWYRARKSKEEESEEEEKKR